MKPDVIRIGHGCARTTTTKHLTNYDRTIADVRAPGREAIHLRVLRGERDAYSAHGRRRHPNLVIVIDEHARSRRQRCNGPATGGRGHGRRERNARGEVVERNLD